MTRTPTTSRAPSTTAQNRTARSYSGVGLTVEPSRAASSSPRRRAGARGRVRRGDMIVRIEGRPAGKLTFEQALNLIKGEGTVVNLTVGDPRQAARASRSSGGRSPSPSLTRWTITFHGAKLGYIRLLLVPGCDRRAPRAGRRRSSTRGRRGSCSTCATIPAASSPQAVRAVSVFLEDGVVCAIAGLHRGRARV